jgi:hypothetical protein
VVLLQRLVYQTWEKVKRYVLWAIPERLDQNFRELNALSGESDF